MNVIKAFHSMFLHLESSYRTYAAWVNLRFVEAC